MSRWLIRILFIYCLNFLKIQSLYLFLAVIKKSIRGKIPADTVKKYSENKVSYCLFKKYNQ